MVNFLTFGCLRLVECPNISAIQKIIEIPPKIPIVSGIVEHIKKSNIINFPAFLFRF